MGYNTNFSGELTFTTELGAGGLAVLDGMLGEDVRDHPEWRAYIPESATGAFYHIDLELTPNKDGIEWNGAEKTYGMVEQVNLILRVMRSVMPEFGLSGSMLAQGEDIGDVWELVINEAGWAERREVLRTSESPHLTPEQAEVILAGLEDNQEAVRCGAIEVLTKIAEGK